MWTQESIIYLFIYFNMTAVKHWLPEIVKESPAMDIFKAHLHTILGNLLWQQEDWVQMISKGYFSKSLSDSVIIKTNVSTSGFKRLSFS